MLDVHDVGQLLLREPQHRERALGRVPAVTEVAGRICKEMLGSALISRRCSI